jgi:hypothetical protein
VREATALERGITTDGKVDFQDLRYFTKLLEARLRERSAEGVASLLHRISEIAADEEQRRLAAWRLGSLAMQLVPPGAFPFAETIAKAAR